MNKQVDWLHWTLLAFTVLFWLMWQHAVAGWEMAISEHDVDHIYVYEWELDKSGLDFGQFELEERGN